MWRRSEDVERGDRITGVGHVVSAGRADRHGTIPLAVVPPLGEEVSAGGRPDPVRPASLGVGGVVEVED